MAESIDRTDTDQAFCVEVSFKTIHQVSLINMSFFWMNQSTSNMITEVSLYMAVTAAVNKIKKKKSNEFWPKHHKYSLSSYEVDKPVVTQSTSMEQWLWCSAANLKVVGSIPVVAVTFWWRRNGRGPCIVWCNCRLKNTECSCIPWLRLLQDEKKFVNVMQLKHGKNSAICSIITGLLLVEKIEVAFINLVPKY